MGIFSSIGHFLFGGPGKSTTNTSSHGVTTVAPYAPIQPALQSYIDGLGKVYGPDGAPQISPLEQSGYDAVAKTAGSSTGVDNAVAANNDTIAGKYLTPDTNPYLADIAKRVGGQTMQAVNATFGGQGRSGSGLAGQFAGQGVGDALTNLYGQTYESERGRQAGAIAQAPTLEAGRYIGPQALISSGQNVSARPFDIAAQQGGVLANIARLGGTTTSDAKTSSKTLSQAESSGFVGRTVNSFGNKLFGN